MATKRLLLIADPASRRCQQFVSECERFAGLLEVDTVPWSHVIETRGCLDQLAAFDREGVVRIDSTGESFDLVRMLMTAGDDSGDWSDVEYRKGWLGRPSLVYRGLKRVLEGLESSFRSRPHLRPLARPSHIARMFDKAVTAQYLAENELPCPRELGVDDVRTGEDVLSAVGQSGWRTVYAKLRTGSSATGIAVIDTATETAQTSMIQIDGDIFNTLRLQTVSRERLIPLLDFLVHEGLSLQEGIPKARIDGMEFDVRVIVIGGKPEFTIFRLSHAPMTNLHFGGRRGDVDECRSRIPTRVWLDAMDTCVEAAALFDAHMVGIDLAFERDYFRHYVLEVNAFGDFFPGWVDARGRTIHQAELESLID